MHHDARPRDIHATIEGKQVWCSLEYNIWRYIHSYHRRHGDPHFTAFRRYSCPPVFNLAPVGITVQVDFTLLGPYCTGKRRAHTVKVDRKLARLHIKRHKVAVDIHTRNLKLTKQLRALHITTQTQVGTHHPRCFFPTGKDGVYHRKVEVTDIDVATKITAALRIGHLHLSIKLAVIGQADGPAQFGTVVTQLRRQIQRLKRHGQRRIVDGLRYLHVTPRKGDTALRQPLFRGVPGNIRFTREDTAGLSGFWHKRFQHGEVEAVEIHHRTPFGPRIDSLRHAQFRIRVKPAVWPDADFLLLIAVIQRNIAGQRPRADRRLEAGIAKSSLPAFFFAIKTSCQIKLPGDRLALNPQL